MSTPADHILLCELPFTGPHGCFEHERRDGCRFVLDAELTVDTALPGQTDRLRDTVDYGAVAERLLAIGTGESVFLVECLAERMASALLEQFPRVSAVRLTLKKLAPPVAGGPAAVGVRITRTRG